MNTTLSLPLNELLTATQDTLTMVGASAALAISVGLPLGISLVLTRPGHLCPLPALHAALGTCINVLRSVPYLILMILCMPLTKWLVGTSLGVWGAVVPLTIGAAPFYARLVEVALTEVDVGCVEMGQSLGATHAQIVWHILLSEARRGLLSGALITTVMLVGYSAMAGVVGGGGLGDLAIRYGYQRFETGTMLLTTALLVVMVQMLQVAGERLGRGLSQK